MAAAFDAGGRLFAIGNGGSACDAQHVAVEFMHPIIEKRRRSRDARSAPTRRSSPRSATTRTSRWRSPSSCALLARAGDIALGDLDQRQVARTSPRALAAAREIGLLTIGFTGHDGGRMPELCDHCFVVPSFSIHRIQETHAILLHVLWDLVHVVRGEEDVL